MSTHLKKVVISVLFAACLHVAPEEVKVSERSRKVKPAWTEAIVPMQDRGDLVEYTFVSEKILSLKGDVLRGQERSAREQLQKLMREAVWTNIVAKQQSQLAGTGNLYDTQRFYRDFSSSFGKLPVKTVDIYVERVIDQQVAEGAPMAEYYKAFILVACSKHQVLGIIAPLAAAMQKSGYTSERQLGTALGAMSMQDLRFAEVKP